MFVYHYELVKHLSKTKPVWPFYDLCHEWHRKVCTEVIDVTLRKLLNMIDRGTATEEELKETFDAFVHKKLEWGYVDKVRESYSAFTAYFQ